MQAYGTNLLRQGIKEEGLKIYRSFDEQVPRHPLITEAINDINAGKRLPAIADSIQAGAAEALYGLGAALGRRNEDFAVIYLQLALYLAPGHAGSVSQRVYPMTVAQMDVQNANGLSKNDTR